MGSSRKEGVSHSTASVQTPRQYLSKADTDLNRFVVVLRGKIVKTVTKFGPPNRPLRWTFAKNRIRANGMKAWSTALIALLIGSLTAQADTDIESLWDYDHPAQAEKKFARLSEEAKLSPNVDLYLQFLTQVARAQGMQQKTVSAHRTLDEVKAALTAKTPTAEIRYDLELGRLLHSMDQKRHAVPLFLKAYELARERKNDDLKIDAARMLGTSVPDFNEQVDWDKRALDIVEKSNDPKLQGWTILIYTNMGWSLDYADRPMEALSTFTKVLELMKEKDLKPGWRLHIEIERLKRVTSN